MPDLSALKNAEKMPEIFSGRPSMRRYARSRPHTLASTVMAAILTCSLVALTPLDAHAGPNLLSDGDFASCTGHNGGFSSVEGPWSLSPGFGCNFPGPSAGEESILSGISASASQTFADTVGVSYTVSAFILVDEADNAITIDAATVITADDLTQNLGWVQYTATFVGSGSDTIDLLVGDVPGFGGFAVVSVSETVPEPASLALFAVGAAALGMVRRRRGGHSARSFIGVT